MGRRFGVSTGGGRRRGALRIALAAVVGVLAFAGRAQARPAAEPSPARPQPKWVDKAVTGLSDACRDVVAGQLRDGQHRPSECDGQLWTAARIVRHEAPRKLAFGVVTVRRIDLGGVELVVSRADRCRAWVLRAPRQEVLEEPDARRAGCRIRRHRGPITLTVVDRGGKRHVGVMVLKTDADGRGKLRFSALDGALRERGLGSLDDVRRIEVGNGGWAGVIDVERLQRFVADWHFEWVRRGRGAPALFDLRHPQHPRAADARALAVEANLARQERDYLAVARGELPPRVFLQRHAWSPYLRSVRNMAARRPARAPAERGD